MTQFLFRLMKHRLTHLSLFTCALLTASLACRNSHTASSTPDLTKINHIIVIYLENHSFDNLYGEFAGANGLSNATATAKQVDSSGIPYAFLPIVAKSTIFPANLPNAPFSIEQFVSADTNSPDLVHRYYQEQMQIDGGKMDKFAAISDAKAFTMGYYHTANLLLATEAKNYTLCDNFFHSAFGGSFLNHIWFISAATPVFTGAPGGLVAGLDANGKLITDGAVTPDGHAVNTLYSVNQPHPATTHPENLLPNQTMPTIGDRLSDKNIKWAWYSGGWTKALAGAADSSFQYHHQPFVYFKNFADGTQAKADHLKDEQEFQAACKTGTLPAVSFVKPVGANNEHPGYTDVLSGEKHVKELIDDIRNGPNWNDCVIIVTYDEHGGFWDHVAPPVIDKWGPGSRVPAIIISPFAKKGFIDHSQYETVSILSLIEHRYGLSPLGTRDASAADMTAALNL